MKKLLTVLALSAMAMVYSRAQGLVNFSAGVTTVTRISTNSTVGGASSGLTLGAGKYIFGLFYSTSATSVNGQTAAVTGANLLNNYAFLDSSWKFAGYATNTASAGRLVGATQNDGSTLVPDVPGGNSARFVVVGWSANIGTTVAAVTAWYNGGNPTTGGSSIGQSAVGGLIPLGDGASIPTPSLFGSSPPALQGFVLGLADGFLYNPAYITSQPTNQTVSLGSTATFQARAYGDVSLLFSYQWKLNGTNLSAGGNYGTTVLDFNSGGIHYADFTLTVTNVQLTNAGNYSVIVANAAGSATSSNALLTIAGVPPFITAQPTNVATIAGASVSLAVSATGSAPMSYQWISSGTNIANATNATLSFINVLTANAGNYSVTITNAYGATNSAVAVLTVQPGLPPTITAQPLPVMVQSGNSATFSVSVSGSAPLSYQWILNSSNLTGATNSTLTLANVQSNNMGSYSVAISNPYGATNSYSATLTVIAPGGYVFFANNAASSTKIFTNSEVGGAPTGRTAPVAKAYLYALYASATATSVNGLTTPIVGGANNNYVFNDSNWSLIAYGSSAAILGRLAAVSPDVSGQTIVSGIPGGSTAQFVVVGWSANVGNNISSVQSWFNNGVVASDGWIGESAVSGAVLLGDGGILPSSYVFGSVAPLLQGFTLGLVSPVPHKSYTVPYIPPAILTATRSGNSLMLSWPLAAGSFSVQSATNPAGPWSDQTLSISNDGTNASATVSISGQLQYFRLIVQ